jgi:hypothetical protein
MVRKLSSSKLMRGLAGAAGLAALLAVRPNRSPLVAARGIEASIDTAQALVLSAQAQRYLQLQYRSFATEFIGCMIGELQGSTVVIRRVAPADVDPSQSTPTHVIPRQTCEGAGWGGTVGVIHSHPSGERCWYYFPGTQVLSSDGQSFLNQQYPVDAIMCGHRVVWIGRDMAQHQTPIGPGEPEQASLRSRPQRGNLVQWGALAVSGED